MKHFASAVHGNHVVRVEVQEGLGIVTLRDDLRDILCFHLGCADRMDLSTTGLTDFTLAERRVFMRFSKWLDSVQNYFAREQDTKFVITPQPVFAYVDLNFGTVLLFTVTEVNGCASSTGEWNSGVSAAWASDLCRRLAI